MSQPALIEIDNAAEEAAGLAYERCETYAWQGQNINWSRGHNWLWLSIIRKADFEIEQDALAVVWVGRMDADEIKKCRRELRKDPTAVIEEVDEFINRYDVQGPELGDAIEIANQIFIDRTPHEIIYELPYAQGLQIMSLRLFEIGNKFLGPELDQGETFDEIAGYV